MLGLTIYHEISSSPSLDLYPINVGSSIEFTSPKKLALFEVIIKI